MTTFYPALAHTDKIGYLGLDGMRKEMSNRRLLPSSMSSEFLTSLSFDEKIHYETTNEDFDPVASSIPPMPPIERVFVDCGAFHYVHKRVPEFKGGLFATALTAWEEYESRHLIHKDIGSFLLCSPDHIIPPDADDQQRIERTQFTLLAAEEFLEFAEKDPRVTPVGVVHGRTVEERREMTESLLDIGYRYIAFGGLVPLARYAKKVLHQLTGTDDPASNGIDIDSPLGLVKTAGARCHAFGLSSPDWYRWWKRMEFDSFDGSKLSQEGAANGIIWVEKDVEDIPSSANEMYRRLQVKKIQHRKMIGSEAERYLEVSSDGELVSDNPALRYLLSSRCTRQKCPHGPLVHPPDPRVTGSIEHNMGRTLLNAFVFESLMGKIDELCELAKDSDDSVLREHWSPIEVGR